jgi:hypothetical protein
MRHEGDELWSGSTCLGRWRVITKPGAAIKAKVLEMSDEGRRAWTAGPEPQEDGTPSSDRRRAAR